ncbi:rhodanese-like domain-containing protein [soil metagenome]
MKTSKSSTEETIRRVNPRDAQKQNTLLLDVRTPAEFEESHIAGAVLHPLSELDTEEVGKLAAGKDECVVVCRSGNRAQQAAEKLRAGGMGSLGVMDGGVLAWEAAGLPLNRGRKIMSLERQVRIAAGSLVFIGAVLGYFVHPAWIALSGFVGAGLVFAGITDTCGMGMVLARMPWNNRRSSTGTCGTAKS